MCGGMCREFGPAPAAGRIIAAAVGAVCVGLASGCHISKRLKRGTSEEGGASKILWHRRSEDLYPQDSRERQERHYLDGWPFELSWFLSFSPFMSPSPSPSAFLFSCGSFAVTFSRALHFVVLFFACMCVCPSVVQCLCILRYSVVSRSPSLSLCISVFSTLRLSLRVSLSGAVVVP